jgi:AcrR family transcriptional regulator
MSSQKQSDPRERILEAADRLFYTEGVRATGTEKIMSVSEVAKATFYRHFPSKDDLVIAYLEYRDRSFFEYLDSPAPPEDIHEALTRIERVVNRADIIGCPFLRIASEYPDFDHPFHRVAVEHENKFLAYLINLLKPFAIEKKSGGSSVTERRRWWPHHENALWDIERDSDSRARRGSTQELSDRANPAPQLMAVVMAP